MTTAYTPEPGSLAARVCTWLQRNREEELTPRDIATKFDVPVQGLHFTLRDAMAHGWVLRSAVNGAYAAGPRLPIAGAPSGEPAKPAPSAPHANGDAKKRRNDPPDLSKLAIKPGVPIPERTAFPRSRVYAELLGRMKAGDMVELTPTQAKSLVTAANKSGVKLTVRRFDDQRTGVWRVA
jgi:hypothetical protein